MESQTIAVIGANGFIGSRLVAEALRHQVRVIALARRRKKHSAEKRVYNELEDNLTPEQINCFKKNLIVIDYDLQEPQIGLAQDEITMIREECQHVFNCAGDTTFFPRDTSQLFFTNVDGPARLIEELCSNGAVFHHVSTAYVAGKRSGVIYESELDIGQRFNNPYEESKHLGEKRVHEVCAQRCAQYNIYRPSIVIRNHVIPGKTPHLNHFYLFFNVLDSLYRDVEKSAQILEDGYYYFPVRFLALRDARLNIVDLDFVTQALFYIGMNSSANGKTFHLVNPRPLSNQEFLDNIIQEIYKTKGLMIVERQEDLNNPNVYEKMIQEWLSNYMVYFSLKLNFDMTNTINALQGSGISHPTFDRAYVARAIGRG